MLGTRPARDFDMFSVEFPHQSNTSLRALVTTLTHQFHDADIVRFGAAQYFTQSPEKLGVVWIIRDVHEVVVSGKGVRVDDESVQGKPVSRSCSGCTLEQYVGIIERVCRCGVVIFKLGRMGILEQPGQDGLAKQTKLLGINGLKPGPKLGVSHKIDEAPDAGPLDERFEGVIGHSERSMIPKTF